MNYSNPNPNPTPAPSGNPLGLVAMLVMAGIVFGGANQQPANKATDATPAVVLGADANAKLAAVRSIAGKDPNAAKRLGLLLNAAGDMIRNDSSTITTTDQLFRFIERAERFNTTPEGAAKLPGIGDAVSAVLKSSDVVGDKVAPLDVAKRKASADALRAISETLRGS